MVYLSGNPFFRMLFFKESVIAFNIIICVFFYKRKLNGTKFSIEIKEFEVFVILLVLIISILFTVIVNLDDIKLATYLSIIMQLIATYLCAISISKDVFINFYQKLILFLAVVSLTFYTLQIVYPNIVYLFPRYQGSYQLYSNAILYNYMIFNDYGVDYLLKRNTGIFWGTWKLSSIPQFGIVFII